jgi:solute carrier family 25 (adenine nucleotide translocator) protein 4/5/6/31
MTDSKKPADVQPVIPVAKPAAPLVAEKPKASQQPASGGPKVQKSKLEQLGSDLLVGGSIGAISKTVMAPVERVKLLMQTQDSNPEVLSGRVARYTSIGDCFRRVSSEQGMKAFWRGNLVNCLRYAPQQGSALAFNDALNKIFPDYNSKTDFWKSTGTKLASGGLAGAIANTICYPFDFARTRLASDLGKGKPQFNGIMDCIVTTVKNQGLTGLYTGWSVTVAGAFVYRAGQLGLFKTIQDMNPYQKDKGTLGAISSFVSVTAARTVIMPFNYPFDTVRRRMMLESEKPVEKRVYKGSFDCFNQVMKKEGLKGMYKGMIPEMFRGVGGSLVIVAYDRIKVIFNI